MNHKWTFKAAAFRLLVPWEPETATFNSPWSQPGLAAGVDYAADPLGSDSLHGSDWIDLDVTGAVRAWLAHPDQNLGLVIMITAAPQGAHYWVNTSDYPLPHRQPRLDITYRP
ncbi:MAG: DNRLRE domain-containing protein [Anaerolineae bacterium]|nr:DNRLRE domain-containing protein [Anaerolineae bacterium]